MKDSTLRTLKLFVEKADDLSSSSFYKFVVQNRGLTVTIGDSSYANRVLPDEPAVDHFLYPIRIFTLPGRGDRDSCSLPSLKKSISGDSSSGVSSAWRKLFDGAYAQYEQLRTEHCVSPHFTQYTCGEVMNVFFYGDKFHTEPKEKEILDGWKAMRDFYPLVEAEFYTTLTKICALVLIIASFTQKELQNSLP